MAITKLNLQPIITESDYSNITIGNSKFNDDEWDVTPFMTTKGVKRCRSRINFKYINSNAMKFVIKQYAYFCFSKLKASTVVSNINSKLPSFIEYCNINNITSFKDVDTIILMNYVDWLRNEKGFSERTGYSKTLVVEELMKVGASQGWNVNKENGFFLESTHLLWNIKKEINNNKVKPIPEDIFNKILYYAINKENDILTKAGIIIQSQTGLRISEVLSIKDDCLGITNDGYEYMEVYLNKTTKDNFIKHKVFINDLVKKTVLELIESTKSMRKRFCVNNLFIKINYADKKIKILNNDDFAYRVNSFIKRWNITDNNGNIYHLRTHQFRATFVRELIKQKVPIAHIMKQFAHVSIEMTSHYLTLQEEEIKEIYSDMILGKDSKIAGLRAKEIKTKLDEQFRGKTEQEIDDIVSNLSKSMSFNPLPTGVCLYDFRRGNCSDGDGCFFYNCPNYVTEVKFYPVLKQELDLMEKEMTRYKELGQQRSWERQYVKYKYLKPLVDSLEEQINEEK
ncbi:tyrosine-type recombinase/integrase [Clostridium sp. B9]|uniref:tyrosine-type recombinase/integrase n=1 Tax=Clostridium sp. B9 TaxID=3423224 RepID=UPI003D2F4D13